MSLDASFGCWIALPCGNDARAFLRDLGYRVEFSLFPDSSSSVKLQSVLLARHPHQQKFGIAFAFIAVAVRELLKRVATKRVAASLPNLMAFACSISLLVVLAAAILAAQASRIEPFISLGSDKPILQHHLVAKVNGHSNAGWKADINSRFANATVKDFKKLLGTFLTSKNEGDFVRTHPRNLKLPKHFDAREAWPECPSIGNILDQGHCGSCWAFGAVEALSDRFCILNKENVTLSENDLVSCCGFECGYGCDGGYPLDAWQYFMRSGVVTTQCDPYFDETGCKHPGCSPDYSTPVCVKQCKDNEDWSDSKHYAESAYRISSDPYDIMAEVFTNGPVEVSFSVFEDFAVYKSGVYKYLFGDYLGGHAVKVLGWGTTEEGLDYWIVANSWNRNWGEDGYFKIARGSNECGIEGDVVAGLPASKSLSGQMYLAQ